MDEKEKYEPGLVSRESDKALGDVSAYINAGGRGTRLEPVVQKGDKGIAKALIEFANKPLLQHHIDLISTLGFKNIIVGAGDHPDVKQLIDGQLTDKLSAVVSEAEYGTGGDLICAVRETDEFGHLTLVENVDTLIYLRDVNELISQHKASDALATIVLTTKKGVPNEGAWLGDDSGNVLFTAEADQKYHMSPPPEASFRGSSTGIVLFNTGALKNFNWSKGYGQLSIYREILPALILQGGVHYYNNENNFLMDVGTPGPFDRAQRHPAVFDALAKRYKDQKSS